MKWLLFGMILTPFVLAELPPDHAEKMGRGLELFRAEVAPLLQEHCIKCHGGQKVKGDF
jgi:mono/diheme cytochrome c family protein